MNSEILNFATKVYKDKRFCYVSHRQVCPTGLFHAIKYKLERFPDRRPSLCERQRAGIVQRAERKRKGDVKRKMRVEEK